MPYPNLGNFADQLQLDPEFAPSDSDVGPDLDLPDSYGFPSSPEEEAEQRLQQMLKELLEELGSY